MPLVQGVPAGTLKVVMPLLAQQQPATTARMLTFLKGVSDPSKATHPLKHLKHALSDQLFIS
jgi:hypothetical protein